MYTKMHTNYMDYTKLLNQHHHLDLAYLEDLKKFSETLVKSHSEFWELKKVENINRKNRVLNEIKQMELNILTLTDVNAKLDLTNLQNIYFLIDNKRYKINNKSEETKKKIKEENNFLINAYNKSIEIKKNKIKDDDNIIEKCTNINKNDVIRFIKTYITDEIKKITKRCIDLYKTQYKVKNPDLTDVNKEIHKILLNRHNDLIRPIINIITNKYSFK